MSPEGVSHILNEDVWCVERESYGGAVTWDVGAGFVAFAEVLELGFGAEATTYRVVLTLKM